MKRSVVRASARVLGLALLAAPILAQAQTSLATMDKTDLGVMATSRFTAQPQIACPAAHEYTRRGVVNTKSEAVKVVVAYCIKNGYPPAGQADPAPVVKAASATPPLGRYVCLRVGVVANAVADDLTLANSGRYTLAGASGAYSYNAANRQLTWTSGPLATAKTQWLGVYVPRGEGTKDPTIVIRAIKDITAGNKRDLQWCNHAG